VARASRSRSSRRFLRVGAWLAAGLLPLAVAHAALDDLPDPTRPGGWSRGGEAAPSGALVLQSVLVAPGRREAIIDGQRLVVGDRIRDHEVIEIRTSEVVLRRAGREIVLKLLPRPLIDKSTGSKP
jgi:hypothetical protein